MASTMPSTSLAGKEVEKRILVLGNQYIVSQGSHPSQLATVLDVRYDRNGSVEAYVSYSGKDKRLDAWVKEKELGEEVAGPSKVLSSDNQTGSNPAPNRATSEAPESSRRAAASPSVESSPEREHATLTRVRNFEDVRFGEYLIKTWYYSPYPLPHAESSSSISHETHLSSRKRKLSDSNGQAAYNTVQPAVHRPVHGNVANDALQQPSKSQMNRTVNDMFSTGLDKESTKRRLWVCDLCFKYMRTRTGWDRHSSSCTMLQPPGRRVYQRGSYTIWEVDGAAAPLYCQNISLFGKLFIDHKSVFFHVENFLFYIICDAATSRRDQAMAFFSKEKVSYDDYNLACIVTFPPFQNRGFGKLLIEFSYYLTKHPSTRPKSLSPGTPERPLSDLGLKGYTAYWASVVLRFLRFLLKDAEPVKSTESSRKDRRMSNSQSPIKPASGRMLRARKEDLQKGEKVTVCEAVVTKMPITGHPGQYTVVLSLLEIAKACHLRIDDIAFTLLELGFLHHRRAATFPIQKLTRNGHVHGEEHHPPGITADGEGESPSGEDMIEDEDLGEWKDVEVVVSGEMIEEAWEKWRVKERGVLDENCVLL
ncbi:hypothetical protein I305_04898 [Cryptococcus gattii E566]|uniref:histone acetyltransferase n=2 Tax=Cryptococcus gattii TaxID=37769 RepID=E6RFU9_CRYGW|nr:Histone acetyltransferase, putative [Cryptococcus gattii WM276]ADV25646.1 Histone acetyltransferase, putative [Cryptococcus gattii WM276]KIR78196.1 hypothetical protein I306_04815 [Cryptococcus gattii EJB2]KIY32739.1 hypothetical protein I305_04898 [Cryptococcus gattii E566]KJE01868.1 hypothetical protein I311_04506 [Cryptococcus gattii NT-10]